MQINRLVTCNIITETVNELTETVSYLINKSQIDNLVEKFSQFIES